MSYNMGMEVRRSRAEEVADRLGVAIESMRPGDRLGTKNELRIQAGVATATMNEAIRLLQARGAITLRTGPKGGVFVAALNPLVRISDALVAIKGKPETVLDSLALRAVLDPLTVIEASRFRSSKDVRDLRAHIGLMRDAINDGLLFAQANWSFHARLIQIGRNEILKNIALGLLEIISSNAINVVHGSKTLEQKIERVRVHEALVDAIEAGDLEACHHASAAHTLEFQSDTAKVGRPPQPSSPL